ncbi:unnamed protein product [Effrenium voratum]|nr:unnamed protein product [Effrenium voratum]
MALKKLLEIDPGRTGLTCSVHGEEAYLFGGHDGESPLKLAEGFRAEEGRGEWRQLPPMLARRCYASACELEGKIYVLGGSADGRTLNTFEVFDPESSQWQQWFAKPPMGTKRTMLAAATAEGRIYVAGGFDGIRDLASAEVYDPRTNAWSAAMDPMGVARSYHCLVAANGSVYALGGQQRQLKTEKPRAHSSVEAFELYCERWLPVPPMSVGRIGAAAAVIRNEEEELIYVVGGSDGEEVLRSGEVFDVKLQRWEELPPMAYPRVGHTAFALKGRLYVLGGIDGKVPLDTFEVFDPKEGWQEPMRLGADA